MDQINASIQTQLNTIGNASDPLLCSACNPCPIVTTEAANIQAAKRQATTLQVQKAQKQLEIDAAQALIVNLSDQTWAANEKSRNAQEVIDAQANYDTLLT